MVSEGIFDAAARVTGIYSLSAFVVAAICFAYVVKSNRRRNELLVLNQALQGKPDEAAIATALSTFPELALIPEASRLEALRDRTREAITQRRSTLVVLTVLTVACLTASSLFAYSYLTGQFRPRVVRLAQFTAGNDTIYEKYEFDSKRGFPNIFEETEFGAGGSIKIKVNGREFSNREEADDYIKQLESKSNHHVFGQLASAGIDPAKFRVLFIPPDEHLVEAMLSSDPKSLPQFLIAVQNDSLDQIVVSRVEFEVFGGIPLLGLGDSEVLDPLGSYEIRMSSRIGTYALDLQRTLKIPSGNSASFQVSLRPEEGGELREPTTKILLGKLRVLGATFKLETDAFLVFCKDRHNPVPQGF